MFRAALVVAVLVACNAAEGPGPGPAGAPSEVLVLPQGELEADHRALEVYMLGRKVGDVRVDRERLADGGERWRTRMLLAMTLDNPGAESMSAEMVEVEEFGADRKFIRGSESMREKGVEETVETRREGDQMVVRMTGPAYDREHRVAIPADFDDSVAVFARLRGEVLAGAALPRGATFSGFDASGLRFSPSSVTLLGRRRVGALEVWEVEEVDDEGQRLRSLYDDGGMLLRSEFGVMLVTLAGTTAPAADVEAKLSSYLSIVGRIDAAADPLVVTVEVAGDDPAAPAIFRDSAYQTVQRAGGVYTLTVQAVRGRGLPARTLPLTEVPAEVRVHLDATAVSQSDDAAIVARAREIVGGQTDARVVAEAIVDWVHAHTEKRDGSRGAATAVETLTAGHGDCTEHTALAVALLRAAGLPARNAAGIVLVPGQKRDEAGYHAWVEVWLGDWVVMDPALGDTYVRPRYLLLGHEEPGLLDGGAELSRLIGRTTIRAGS